MNIRLVPPLEKYPAVVAGAQRPLGKLLLLGLFSLFFYILSGDGPVCLSTGAAIFAFSFWPQRRRAVLTAATLLFVVFGFTDFYWADVAVLLRASGIPEVLLSPVGAYLSVGLVLLVCSGCVHLVRNSPPERISRPNLVIVTLYSALLCLATFLPPGNAVHGLLWLFLIIFGRYLWFLCFSLKECRYPEAQPFPYEVGRYMPFWMPGNIPYPKGYAYLRKIAAKDPKELAVTQIKGLKLIVWAWLLSIFAMIYEGFLYGQGESLRGVLRLERRGDVVHLLYGGDGALGLFTLPAHLTAPRYNDAFDLCLAGNPLPWYANWASLVTHFLSDIMLIAITSHIIIAVIRMCGYKALRNVYKPLQSRTVTEFWNRMYFYFKEMLLELFFYPTFFRYFKNRPALRLYFATFAAAGAGNFLFHFFRDIEDIFNRGFFGALVALQSYAFYAFVLSLAIFLSQWRRLKRKRRISPPLLKYLAPLGVLGFYCVLNVFGDLRKEGLVDHFAFFLSLFNVHLH